MRKGAYWGIGLFVLVLSLCAVFPADAGMIGLFSPSSEEDRRIAEVVIEWSRAELKGCLRKQMMPSMSLPLQNGGGIKFPQQS